MTDNTEKTSGKKLELNVGDWITNANCICYKYAGKENNEDIFVGLLVNPINFRSNPPSTEMRFIGLHKFTGFGKNETIQTDQINEYNEGTEEFRKYLGIVGGFDVDGFRIGELK